MRTSAGGSKVTARVEQEMPNKVDIITAFWSITELLFGGDLHVS